MSVFSFNGIQRKTVLLNNKVDALVRTQPLFVTSLYAQRECWEKVGQEQDGETNHRRRVADETQKKVTDSSQQCIKGQSETTRRPVLQARGHNRTRPPRTSVRQLQQSPDVVDPGGFPVAAGGAEGLVQQVLLLPLDLRHPLLHRVLHDKLPQSTGSEDKNVKPNVQAKRGDASNGFATFAPTFVTTTFLVCPSRWQRSMHCSSDAGFHAWNNSVRLLTAIILTLNSHRAPQKGVHTGRRAAAYQTRPRRSKTCRLPKERQRLFCQCLKRPYCVNSSW